MVGIGSSPIMADLLDQYIQHGTGANSEKFDRLIKLDIARPKN